MNLIAYLEFEKNDLVCLFVLFIFVLFCFLKFFYCFYYISAYRFPTIVDLVSILSSSETSYIFRSDDH